jgi:hypothetical protein
MERRLADLLVYRTADLWADYWVAWTVGMMAAQWADSMVAWWAAPKAAQWAAWSGRSSAVQ